MENETLFLVYVNPIGKNAMGLNEYEFFFSEKPESVWAGDWNIECPSACSDLIPDSSMYSLIKRVETTIPLNCAQENCCFSMSDCVDGIISLVYENISGLESYPEPYRINIKYGEKYKRVVEILSGRNINLKD